MFHNDSHTAIRSSGKEGVNRCNKHIGITYHYICDGVAWKEATLQYKPANDMIANIFINSLWQLAFSKLVYLARIHAKDDVCIVDQGCVLVKLE